ncbi:hypothetical protein MMC11_006305 [Xylographa trunciseda]|nr:hypothetical protein [Xylographa trunciseda]
MAVNNPTFTPAGSKDFHGIPYEATIPGKLPVNITVAPPPPSSARLGIHPLLRPSTSPSPSPSPSFTGSTSRSQRHHGVRRDSGLAPSNSTARESGTTLTDAESAASVNFSSNVPRITSNGSAPPSIKKFRRWSPQKQSPVKLRRGMTETTFRGITTDIPSIDFEDLTSLDKAEFSNRGSMLIAGQRANPANVVNGHVRTTSRIARPSTPSTLASPSVPLRVLSAADEVLSQKVRSMYEAGTDQDTTEIEDNLSNLTSTGIEEAIEGDEPSQIPNGHILEKSKSHTSRRESFIKREDHELAGGVEDWQDINGGDVDRYGFIVPRASVPPPDSSDSVTPTPPKPPQLQRASTVLQLASEVPRKERKLMGRMPSVNGSTRSTKHTKQRARAESRPPSSQGSYRSTTSRSTSRMRSATNLLPHNRERRCMDEAGDMLTLPPGLADIAENESSGKVVDVDVVRRKEWEREEKWRKMAKPVKKTADGGGMVFDFDVRDPKLIQRTWKGIPDRWRATAWHAFLSSSAKKNHECPSDEELIADFNELLDQGSPDDVQIDIDVPRTINSHIMFRRRYRGGQRLLFRVLHCLSIYFPDTGYVQGMAALAATLLCYFDEEMTFVMLVRMWQLRGLARLYQPGFDGLMEALDEFEKKWLVGGEVAKKLTELGISPTAYGTRWYLTVFNYSIPFPAQLRVWDVWMLLGDADSNIPTTTNKSPSFNGGLDVLHATSAALIDGTREILLDSDFENAMKVLTSWIPVRDEELLMRVAKAEWKMHRRKR